MEGQVITTQDLFKFIYEGEMSDGSVAGRFSAATSGPTSCRGRNISASASG